MKKHSTLIFTLAMSTIILLSSWTSPQQRDNGKRKTYYCEYCGHKFPSVRLLVSATCPRHPDGSNKGRHKLYEGSEKSEYTCKYCGHKFPSIMLMTGGTCLYHPKGSHKGGHTPAL